MIGRNKPIPQTFHERLAVPYYYEQAIVRLHRKFHQSNTNKIYTPTKEGYNLMQAFLDRKRMSVALAHDVSKGLHVFSPAHINHIVTTDKVRKVFSFTLTDQIINTAIYLMLAPEMQAYISPFVHSYIKQRGRNTAIDAFMKYLRKHRASHPDIKTRGVFVLRSDIKAYGESIPVDPNSPIWGMLESWFKARFGSPPNTLERNILISIIRPQIEDGENNAYENCIGIPDGAPISALLLNLYAKPLDDALSSIEGGIYLRFGDDFLFAHTDSEQLHEATLVMRQTLQSLNLLCNEKKTRQFYLNGAARSKDGIKGTSFIEFLGCQLHFKGTVALKDEKIKLFLQDIRARIVATLGATKGNSLEARGKMVSDIINQATKPHTIFANPQSAALMRVVSDRGQLRTLDKHIARMFIFELTKNPSIKQFRKFPYRMLRDQWRLKSLEYERN